MSELQPNQSEFKFNKEVEREVKVTELGELEDYDKFKEKVKSLGGELADGTQELYLIDDLRLKFNPDLKTLTKTTLDASRFGGKEKVVHAMALLNFKLVLENENFLVFSRQDIPERRTVRIRNEGGKVFFAVKEIRNSDAESSIDEREEAETEVKPAGEEDGFSYIRGVLSQVGYKKDSARQKKRTKFKVDNCSVEYNLGPIGKPWMEIEGPNKEEILETLTKMGFGEGSINRISDRQNYINQGYNEDQLKKLRFEVKK